MLKWLALALAATGIEAPQLPAGDTDRNGWDRQDETSTCL